MSDGSSRGLPRAFQRSCLLLFLSDGQAHGYELLDAVRNAGLRSAEAGGLYRCLRSMEEDRLVTSWWEPSQQGPPRRTYVLTDDGRAATHTALEDLREIRLLLDGLLESRHDSDIHDSDMHDSGMHDIGMVLR